MEITDSVIADILNEAAADIEDYGWKPGGVYFLNKEDDPLGTYPRCPWIAVVRVVERTPEIRGSSIQRISVIHQAELAMLKAAGVENIGHLFDINDTQPRDKGQEWAINLLKTAANYVNGVPVPESSERETDSISTPYQDSGSTDPVGKSPNWLTRKFNQVKSSLSAHKGY